MGEIVAFPIARTHVGVERVAREIIEQTRDHPERRIDVTVNRAARMYNRALVAGVQDAVAHEQAQDLCGMLGEWIEALEWQERANGDRGGGAMSAKRCPTELRFLNISPKHPVGSASNSARISQGNVYLFAGGRVPSTMWF